MTWRRWRWLLACMVGLGLFYTSLGFWGLPWLLKQSLPRLSSTFPGLEVKVSRIEFNPYTLRLEAQGVQWLGRDQLKWLELDRLLVDLQWSSGWHREWRLDEVRLLAPSVRVSVDVDGRSNWGDIWQELQSRLTPSDRAVPAQAWYIESFALEQGRMDIQDAHHGYANRLDAISVRAERIGPLNDGQSPYRISVESSVGESLLSEGAISLKTWQGAGYLALNRWDLASLSVYGKAWNPLMIKSGWISARWPFHFSHTAEGFQFRLAKAEMSLQNLALLDQAGPLVELTGLNVVDGQFDFGGQMNQPAPFQATVQHVPGGHVRVQGHVVPASRALEVHADIEQWPLQPLQPLLSRVLNARLPQGWLSGKGQWRYPASDGASNGVGYVGSVELGEVVLKDLTDEVLLSAKRISSERVEFRAPEGMVDVPELKVVMPYVKLDIDERQGLNWTRLRKQGDSTTSPAKPSTEESMHKSGAQTAKGLDWRLRRLRVEQGSLDFTDRSLRPAFKTSVHQLYGVILGLSSDPASRSPVELDGQVDVFGRVRIRGELQLAHPLESSDIRAQFNNLDLASITPYMMKFGGYRIREGRLSADLRYTLRRYWLDGHNELVVDSLVLGERVESPNALDLPIEMAIALLQDDQGRIELGLPISGDLRDPHIQYGEIVWKALGNLLTGFITAPFRTLAKLLGTQDEGLSVIAFDAGSDRLTPPELEKIQRVAEMLAKRSQLQLLVPAAYQETLDSSALREYAFRAMLAQRLGIQVREGGMPDPVNLGDPQTQSALKQWCQERHCPSLAASLPPNAPLDHAALLTELTGLVPLAPDALTRLAQSRSQAVMGALRSAGVQAERMRQGELQAVDAGVGQQVPLGWSLVRP